MLLQSECGIHYGPPDFFGFGTALIATGQPDFLTP
jgi:hypothetical protein